MARPVLVAAAAVAIFIAAAAAYWMHGVARKQADQRELTALLRHTTEQLRQALAPGAPASLVADIDADLQGAKAPGEPGLAEAAELYIVGAREIARRRVEAERLSQQVAASRAALHAYMARSGARNAAWLNGAAELERRVEREHSDLAVALQALDELLYSLPDSEKGLVPRIPQDALLGEAERDAALKQTRLEAKQAKAELERVRGLAMR